MKKLTKLEWAWIVLGVIALVLSVIHIISNFAFNYPWSPMHYLIFFIYLAFPALICLTTYLWMKAKYKSDAKWWFISTTVLVAIIMAYLAFIIYLYLCKSIFQLPLPLLNLASVLAWFLITCKLHKKRFT